MSRNSFLSKSKMSHSSSLASLRMIPVFKPSIGKEEIDAIGEVINSSWIGQGPKTAKFEKNFAKFIGAKNVVATNSASAALHLAIISLGLKVGDEVITPSLTFVATNHPILMCGAIPVFADVEQDTLCADVEDIKQKITKKTKAIMIVHYGGHPVDLDSLVKVCREKKIILIEDCAHATGSYYKKRHVGTFGDLSCFSFAAIKNLTTGDGGMLVGKSKKIIDNARVLAWSGISQSTWARAKSKKLKWRYNVASTGYKYQMNDIAGAFGLVQLAKLEENNERRKKITETYNKAFSTLDWIETPVVKDFAKSSHHNYVIKVPAKIRDRLSDYLSSNGIVTSVHYEPTHHYKLYSKFKARVPVTEKVWKKILLLPIFPDLTLKDQEYIIKKVKEFK